MVPSVERTVRAYQLIAGLYTLSASLIWGVNTLFLLDAGLDILGVFVANAAFMASMAVFEVPTGVLADSRGRRASFLLSVAIVLLGTLCYLYAAASGGGLGWFVAASVVLGLGVTFYSVAVEAWLAAAGHAGGRDGVFARGAMVTGAAMLAGSVGGGVLGSLDLAWPFWVRAGLLALVFGVAWAAMHDVGFTPRRVRLAELPGEMAAIARHSVALGWRRRAVRYLILMGLVQSAFLAWAFYAWQPYLLELLGQNAVWVAGVVTAALSLATIAGNALVNWFSRFCGQRTTLLACAGAAMSLAAVGVGLVSSFWAAVALLVLVFGAMGVVRPVKQAYLHQAIPSAQRATVVSFDSLVASGGGALSQWGLGALAQAQSIAAGFWVGGLASLLALPAVALLRRLGEDEDRIVGEAGRRGPCAGQGLPKVTAVETTARRA